MTSSCPDGMTHATKPPCVKSPGHPDSGMWTLPGGGLEWGESAEAAAVRELAEESGTSAELGPVIGVYSRWDTAQEAARSEPGLHFGVVYSSTSVTGDLRVDFGDDDSTDAAGWLTSTHRPGFRPSVAPAVLRRRPATRFGPRSLRSPDGR